jgi:hypothetical protein
VFVGVLVTSKEAKYKKEASLVRIEYKEKIGAIKLQMKQTKIDAVKGKAEIAKLKEEKTKIIAQLKIDGAKNYVKSLETKKTTIEKIKKQYQTDKEKMLANIVKSKLAITKEETSLTKQKLATSKKEYKAARKDAFEDVTFTISER